MVAARSALLKKNLTSVSEKSLVRGTPCQTVQQMKSKHTSTGIEVLCGLFGGATLA